VKPNEVHSLCRAHVYIRIKIPTSVSADDEVRNVLVALILLDVGRTALSIGI
jgi:hypothetical protein